MESRNNSSSLKRILDEDEDSYSLFHVKPPSPKNKLWHNFSSGKKRIDKRRPWTAGETYLYVEFLRESFNYF